MALTVVRRFDDLLCPVCRSPLQAIDRRLVCSSGHSYDIAREGYVNLLGPSGPSGRQAGDSRDMIDARRQFLERGHYAALDEALIAEVRAAVDGRDGAVVVDAGCGDAWHLGQVHSALGGSHCRAYGLDLSKAAARRGAKRFAELALVVSNLKRSLPFADASVDVLLSAFAPRNPGEFRRVLAPHGRLIVVVPGPSHLAALRTHVPLLPITPDKEAQVRAAMQPLEQIHRRDLLFDLRLTPTEAATLLDMTPNFWAVPEAARQALRDQPQDIVVGAEFVVLTFAVAEGETADDRQAPAAAMMLGEVKTP